MFADDGYDLQVDDLVIVARRAARRPGPVARTAHAGGLLGCASMAGVPRWRSMLRAGGGAGSTHKLHARRRTSAPDGELFPAAATPLRPVVRVGADLPVASHCAAVSGGDRVDRHRIDHLPGRHHGVSDGESWLPECLGRSTVHQDPWGRSRSGHLSSGRYWRWNPDLRTRPLPLTMLPSNGGVVADFSVETWWLDLIIYSSLSPSHRHAIMAPQGWKQRLGLQQQTRLGPNVNGPLGLSLYNADAGKLIMRRTLGQRR